jgi:hypothetical protein
VTEVNRAKMRVVRSPTVLLLFFAASLVFAHTSFAATDGQGGGRGLHLQVLEGVSIGAFGTSDGAVANRSMLGISASLLATYRIKNFGLGLIASYLNVGQITASNSVGNTNLSGDNLITGIAAIYSAPKFFILASYDLNSNYSLFNSTSTGQSQKYTGSKGVHLGGGYWIAKQWSLGLAYINQQFKTSVVNGINIDLDGAPLNQTLLEFNVGFQIF